MGLFAKFTNTTEETGITGHANSTLRASIIQQRREKLGKKGIHWGEGKQKHHGIWKTSMKFIELYHDGENLTTLQPYKIYTKCHLQPSPKMHTPFCWTTLLQGSPSGGSTGGSAQTPAPVLPWDPTPAPAATMTTTRTSTRARRCPASSAVYRLVHLGPTTTMVCWVSSTAGKSRGKSFKDFFSLLSIRRQRIKKKKERNMDKGPSEPF